MCSIKWCLMVHHTGGGPALAEDSQQLSAPSSLPLWPLFKGLRDWTIFQGFPRSSVRTTSFECFLPKLFLTSFRWSTSVGGSRWRRESRRANKPELEMFFSSTEVRRSRAFHQRATSRPSPYSLGCVLTDVDFVTPLCSQVVYEGLVDDIFRIKCGEYERSCPVNLPPSTSDFCIFSLSYISWN